MHSITLKFPNVSKEAIEQKLEPAMKRFELTATYEEETVTILGTPEQIRSVQQAYVQQKLIHDMMNQFF